MLREYCVFCKLFYCPAFELPAEVLYDDEFGLMRAEGLGLDKTKDV